MSDENNNNTIANLESRAFTVTDFLAQTNDFFKRLGYVLVKGEISQVSFKNHLYFTIKDDNCAVKCVMFASHLRKISFPPEVGQSVIVYGTSSIYAKLGTFSINVEQMELAGLGYIMEQLRLLDIKLAQEGVYNVKRPLPKVIQNVAVVTSAQGRVIDDIRTNVLRRNHLVALHEFPCLVQGPTAPESIVKSLYQAYSSVHLLDLDVIIVGRGGGSFEELLCFSDERVVRAIAQSPIPIISAVGHDEDRPLCDKAADLRVSTPTAAAEIVTSNLYVDYIARIQIAMDDFYNQVALRLDYSSSILGKCIERLESSSVFKTLNHHHISLNNLTSALDKAMQLVEVRQVQKIDNLVASLERHGVNEKLFKYEQIIESSVVYFNNFAASIDEKAKRLNQTIEYLFSKSFNYKLEEINYRLENNIVKALDKNLQLKLDSLSDRLLRAQQRLNELANFRLYEISAHNDNKIANLQMRLEHAIQAKLQATAHKLLLQENMLELGDNYPNTLPSYFDTKLMHKAKVRVDNLLAQLEHIEAKAFAYETRIDQAYSKIDRFFDATVAPYLKDYETDVAKIITKLQSLNPLYQLERGLSLTTVDGDHSVNGSDLEVGQEIITILKDYQIISTINSIEYKPLHLDKPQWLE